METQRQNDVETPEMVPKYYYDDLAVRSKHRDHLHWIGHLVQALITVYIITLFVWYLNQYDFVSSETVTIDGADGIANYIGKDGNIYNGQDFGEAHPVAHEKEREK